MVLLIEMVAHLSYELFTYFWIYVKNVYKSKAAGYKCGFIFSFIYFKLGTGWINMHSAVHSESLR